MEEMDLSEILRDIEEGRVGSGIQTPLKGHKTN